MLVSDNRPTTVNATDTTIRLSQATKGWGNLDKDEIDQALKLARESVDEAKAQTEYQDQKATRLLTIITFVSALSAALFSRFADAYPIPQPPWPYFDFRIIAVGVAYAAFALFVLSAAAGALVTFHAIRTRFKYPEPDLAKQEEDPKSQIFYAAMVSVTPEAWARSYVAPTAPAAAFEIRSDLKERYLRNYIIESYLVAAKTADKLRYLEPAQRLLAFSLGCLLVWLALVGAINLTMQSTKAPTKPTEFRLVR
jgi:hypothetical protein